MGRIQWPIRRKVFMKDGSRRVGFALRAKIRMAVSSSQA
jgi:hypothetical protein